MTLSSDHLSHEPLHEPWTLGFAYTRTTGAVLGRFFAGLYEKRILGRRAADGSVFVPPLEYDPRTSEPLTDWVDVGPDGTLEGYTFIAAPLPTHPRREPFAFGLVRLDGADTPLLHVVEVARQNELHVGLRVTARWAEERKGHILDLSGFRPLMPGEHTQIESKGELPPLASRTFTYPMALHYDVRAGHALSAHLRGLEQGRFVARRCTRCARVYIPPLGACPVCSIAVDEAVELPPTGVVTTFCIVNLQVRGQEHLERPFACANVLLDGSDTPFLTLLQGCAPSAVRAGMRVRAVWKEAGERSQSLSSVRHFEPTGEPDERLVDVQRRRKEAHRA
jgi:uncharacterized OB-fold protein